MFAAITIDSGQGYVIEGTRFGSSQMDREVIHLNAPTAAGAPHKAIGIHFDKGATPSDDPDIQLIGSSVP
jgi:hypothetical protein